VDDPGVLRVLRFRPLASEFDASLREEILPAVSRAPGLMGLYAGRQGPDELGVRVVVSCWSDLEAMAAAVGRSLDDSASPIGYRGRIAEASLTILPLAFSVRDPQERDPAVLRVTSGQAKPGQLDRYIEEARRGVHEDIAAGHGPMVLHLATDPPVGFVTCSIWPDWASIEVATGGQRDRPISTRHRDRLEDWAVQHYEVLATVPTPR
jgi:hypothetical protein